MVQHFELEEIFNSQSFVILGELNNLSQPLYMNIVEYKHFLEGLYLIARSCKICDLQDWKCPARFLRDSYVAIRRLKSSLSLQVTLVTLTPIIKISATEGVGISILIT